MANKRYGILIKIITSYSECDYSVKLRIARKFSTMRRSAVEKGGTLRLEMAGEQIGRGNSPASWWCPCQSSVVPINWHVLGGN